MGVTKAAQKKKLMLLSHTPHSTMPGLHQQESGSQSGRRAHKMGNPGSPVGCVTAMTRMYHLPSSEGPAALSFKLSPITKLILISWPRWLLQSKLHRKEFRRKKCLNFKYCV